MVQKKSNNLTNLGNPYLQNLFKRMDIQNIINAIK